MNEELQAKIERLPKWAQRYISKLQKDVAWYKTQLDKVETNDTVIRWDLITEGTGGGIPERAHVLFDLDGGTLECALRNGALRIRGNNLERPVVRPEAINVILVSAEK